jgi:hypothetical protein
VCGRLSSNARITASAAVPTDGVIVIGVCTSDRHGRGDARRDLAAHQQQVGRGLPRRSGRLVETALHAAAGEHRVVGGSHQLAGDRRTERSRAACSSRGSTAIHSPGSRKRSCGVVSTLTAARCG